MATGTTIVFAPPSDDVGDDQWLTLWLPIIIAGLASMFGICIGCACPRVNLTSCPRGH
jgi:hypothetical protein